MRDMRDPHAAMIRSQKESACETVLARIDGRPFGHYFSPRFPPTLPTSHIRRRPGDRAQEEQQPYPMSHYDQSLQDRRNLAAEAKKNLLAKFKKNADPNSPEAIEKRRQREAIAAARVERQAQREQARREHEAELARQAAIVAAAKAETDRLAAEKAAADAAAQAELDAMADAELKAEQKAARDARYAARKAAKKKRRRGL
jgi:membrane protein involved in colicin uptake